ncbi:MAG TPA: TVP38/TMEM64 family protein [Stellaceae bacterium]|nr:TVP38/TMEM64 family protein [Stellaceae bacterium]
MAEAQQEQRRGARLRRLLPLLVLIAAIAGFFASGLGRYLSFAALAEHRDWLLGWVAREGVLAPLAFIAVYTAVAALSVPGGLFLTVAGGFLFGTWLGGLLTLIGATLGASIIFLIARSSLGDPLRQRAGPFLRRVEAGFRENGASYLLVLRLVPLFPFWLVNLVPAFFGVSLRTFVLCSFFGMAPGSFVYSSVGAGAGALIERGEAPDLHVIFQPRLLLPLIALALLSLLPVLYKWHQARSRRRVHQ